MQRAIAPSHKSQRKYWDQLLTDSITNALTNIRPHTTTDYDVDEPEPDMQFGVMSLKVSMEPQVKFARHLDMNELDSLLVVRIGMVY